MDIGAKIKELRKKRGITQERLAEYLNISPQAVSKWESGLGYPDIALLPTIASYFEVSIDLLFDFERKYSAEVERICNEAYKHRESEPVLGNNIIKEGLEKYPNNDILLANLLYTMDYSKNPDEVIAVANKIIKETADDEIKYDALRFLAYAYSAKGDDAAAFAALEQIPELYFTKLSEAARLLKGKAKYDAAEKQMWVSFEILLQMIEETAEYFETEHMHDRALREYERGLSFIRCMSDKGKICKFDNYAKAFNEKLNT
ncbi:MAG: helix-turn-helix transcriptional regulator [Oscillospiraceae bacterium]|nr:helix-turn-helix transcriptional regulator [Oscillospiraceae bacterium]